MVDENEFFHTPKPESLAKIDIVVQYFDAWTRVLGSRAPRLGYVDLFAGPGRYEDGTDSVPLRILKMAMNRNLQGKLITIFNDSDYSEELKRNIYTLPYIAQFSSPPEIHSETLESGCSSISTFYARVKNCPTFSFIDPWGYKGLTLDLLASTTVGFGCDCIFFFNYSRINSGLENPIFCRSMDQIFGEERSQTLRNRLHGLAPYAREKEIINEMVNALRSAGAAYVHDFRFAFADRPGRTSHYLFLLSKHAKADRIIKRITSKKSTSSAQGIANFSFDRDEHRQGILFDMPADELRESLLTIFAGQTWSVASIIAIHPKRSSLKCTDSNYKMVLMEMERTGEVTADRPANTRPPGTLADSVKISFLKKRRSS